MTSGRSDASVFIAGHYGFHNLGDEAVLRSMVAHLRELQPDLRITVSSGLPDDTAQGAGVNRISWTDVQALEKAVAEADLVIVGGGGLFHDDWGLEQDAVLTPNHPGLSFLIGPCLLAAIHGKPLMLYAVGVGPLIAEPAREFTRLACDIASAVTVRDPASKQVLELIGVLGERVAVTADPAFAFPNQPDSVPEREMEGHARPRVVVCPRNWSIGAHPNVWQAEFAAGLDQFLDQSTGTVLFVPFSRAEHSEHDDLVSSQQIRARMRHSGRTSVVERELAPPDAFSILSSSDLVVGMRLHSTILAIAANTPVVSVIYDPDVEQAMKAASLGEFTIALPSLKRGALAEMMIRALHRKSVTPREELAEKARENSRIAFHHLVQPPRASMIDPRLAAVLRTAISARIRTERDLRVEAHRLFGEVEFHRHQSETERSEIAELKSGMSVLEMQLQTERRAFEKERDAARNLDRQILQALDQFHSRLSSALAQYRSQRAWKLMVAIRTAYARLMRDGLWSFCKWAIRLPFAGSAELYREELTFPNLWNFVPERFQIPPEEPRETLANLPAHKYDIVIFAIFDFECRFQRPQQLAAEFARRGHRVFWITPSRFLPPDAAKEYASAPLRENIWEVRLHGNRPDLYGGRATPQEAFSLAGALAKLFRNFGVSESCAVVQFPYWRQTALQLRTTAGTKIIYDCMDDWRHWTAEPCISRFNIDEEDKLARECDVLVASSEGLAVRHRAAGLDTLVIRNGADFDFFATPSVEWNKLESTRPIAGYYGAIANWFDVDLVAEVARSRPQYQFVLVGQVHQVDVSRLQKLSNVHLAGEKIYREIPRYLAQFDVAMIPFKINALTSAVDPVKLYEYLSQGKPVVATQMAELNRAKDLILIANNAADFASKLDQAMQDKDANRRAKRIEFARANTWSARVAQIDRALSNRFPLVSILIVTHNCQEFIKPCLDSVARNSSWPNYEVILVDNHSTDETPQSISACAASDPRIRLVQADKNLGFSGGNNLASRSARGDYLLFLNPDTVVTPGWIGRLFRHLETARDIGAVAAVTNFSGNETKVSFAYRDVLEMEKFARQRAANHAGEAIDIAMAPLYCVLVPRAAWDRVGGLDEKFEMGMFEDDDFSLRLKTAGYRVIAAEDCFIHHFGNGSFSKIPPERTLLTFEENKRRFEAKWNQVWKPHSLRAGVSSPYEEIRFTPDEFLRAASGCRRNENHNPVLRRLHPATAQAGNPFNVQPGGEAAIVVECANATPGTIIRMGSSLLASSFGNENLLRGIVPAEVYARRGLVPVTLINDFGESNALEFRVD